MCKRLFSLVLFILVVSCVSYAQQTNVSVLLATSKLYVGKSDTVSSKNKQPISFNALSQKTHSDNSLEIPNALNQRNLYQYNMPVKKLSGGSSVLMPGTEPLDEPENQLRIRGFKPKNLQDSLLAK